MRQPAASPFRRIAAWLAAMGMLLQVLLATAAVPLAVAETGGDLLAWCGRIAPAADGGAAPSMPAERCALHCMLVRGLQLPAADLPPAAPMPAPRAVPVAVRIVLPAGRIAAGARPEVPSQPTAPPGNRSLPIV